MQGVGKYPLDLIMEACALFALKVTFQLRDAAPCQGKVFMKKQSVSKMILAAGLAAACMWGMTACTSEEAQEPSGLTGGVAAIVGGVEIAEDDVTMAVEAVRTQYDITDEASWADWMHTYGYTSESVREEVLDGYIEQELVRQGAKEAGIVIEAAEIDSYVNSMKSQFEDDEAWLTALEGAGFADEAEYRETIETSLVVERFEETFTTDEKPSDEDMLMYAQMYSSSLDGAKRSSHILFDASDEATAQQVLDQINAGEIEFADAAKEYSLDGSGATGGDVGWDALTTFVTEYQTGLDALAKGEVSGLVPSQFGIHIILCTDVYEAPEDMSSLDGFPQEFHDMIYDMLYEQLCADTYQAWLDEKRESVEIVINDMPAGLSYYVDMEAYEAEHATEGEDGAEENVEGADSEGSSDESAADDAATADDASADEGAAEGEGETTDSQPAAQ